MSKRDDERDEVLDRLLRRLEGEFFFYTGGSKQNGIIPRSVTSWTVERTIEGASTMTVTLRDADRAVLRSDALVTDDGGRLGKVDWRFGKERWADGALDGLTFRLVKVAKLGGDIEIVLEDQAVAALREAKEPRKARRAPGSTRVDFVRSLVQSVKVPQIPFRAPELSEGVQPVARRPKDEREQLGEAEKNPGLDRGVRYTIKGQRASSVQLRTVELAMSEADRLNVDRRVRKAMLLAGIAEGQFVPTRLNFQGSGALGPWQVLRSTAAALGIPYDGSDTAILKAARAFMVGLNGSGFRGPGYDATSLLKANPHWSASQIATTVEGAGVGNFYTPFEDEAEAFIAGWGGGSVSSERGGTVTVEGDYFFSVGKPQGPKGENYWDATGRMAEEVGRRRFVVNGEFWWISEKDLFARRVGLTISEDTPGIESIDFDMDNGKRVKECVVECRAEFWKGSPGGLVRIEDLGPATGVWLVTNVSQDLFSTATTVTLRKPIREKKEPPAPLTTRSVAENDPAAEIGEWTGGPIKAAKGAKYMVEQAVAIAKATGGSEIYVMSDYRPGDPKDHGSNDWDKAARDIGKQGTNAHTGPPTSEVDAAVVAIGKAFGRDYGDGKRTIIDTFTFYGWRVQIIWRTPLYGGHMGHIHIGIRKL